MNMHSFLNNQATNIYKKFAGNPGHLLLWTGTIGWILSSVAQITAIGVNSNIPKDQKRFLIPQEIADAAVNIASFFALTHSCTRLGEWLVKSGRLSTPKIRKFLTEFKLTDKVGTKGFNIKKLPQMDELKKDFNKDFQEEYYKFADGISFISSTIGSIISGNIITAYARNYLGAKEQKRSIAKEKAKNLMIPTSPLLPAQNRLSIDAYKNKMAITASYQKQSSGMKI